jgi:DNA-binding NtrC family response regulator
MLAKAIAVIDDEADLVNLFSEAITLNSFKVCTFTNPIEALNHIEKNPDEYSLIISDFRMPKMNGNELCTKLLELNPNLKIFLMSAYADIQYDTSKFTFINKPIPLTKLVSIVKENI